MQQGQVLSLGRYDLEFVCGLVDQCVQVERVRRWVAPAVDQQDLFQPGKFMPSRLDLPLYCRAVVTRTRASPSCSRWQTGSGPNAENKGETTLPFLSAPRAVM
jgi:hypothetical protein